MKLWSAFFALVLVLVFALGGSDAYAGRMSGGKSMGRQSSNVTQRQQAAPPAAPAAAPAAAAPKRPWGAMLGGLAAGLGLGMLMSHLGLGAGFANFIMLALLAVAGVVAIRWVMRKFQNAAPAKSPYAFQNASMSKGYSPSNVGNDASARPWERASMPAPLQAGGGSMIGSGLNSGLGGEQTWGIPADFDRDGFLAASKTNFVKLQDAFDRRDAAVLRSLMTDEMVNEMQAQMASQAPAAAHQKTSMPVLNAQLLGIEEQQDVYMASVEFSGMMSEDAFSGAKPFREVWNMTKAKAGGGWLVAGVQVFE